MSDIFAMQRANSDWFALEHHGRLRVPLFHSSQDAMIAGLNRGSTMRRTQLALLIRRPDKHEKIVTNRKTFHLSDLSALTQSESHATETWEDEGGAYAKCA